MILRYEISMDDLVAFNRYHSANSPAIKRSKSTFMILVSGLVVGLSLLIDPPPGIARSVVASVAVLFALLFSFIFNRVFRSSLDRHVRRLLNEGANKGCFGWHELEIDNDGLVERTEVNETRHSWQGIEKIAETESHAFLYTSSFMAHVIPKQSISTGDAVQFIADAKQLWLAANPDKRAEQEE